jgi:hypothetical protein
MAWATSYWLPAEYTVQSKWPPYDWMTRQPPFQPFTLAHPPADFKGPWWFYPKSEWPAQYQTPFEPKIFGAFSARKVMMPKNLQGIPPFGYIRVKTPSDPHSINPNSGKAPSPPTLTPIKVHMRQSAGLDINPNPSLWQQEKLKVALQEMSRKRPIKLVTENGTITIKSMRSANWGQHQNEMREYRAAIKAKREERAHQMLAAEIVRTRGIPQRTKDLFT